MFVRLTKKDGAPIWFNASYIVTVEPMRSGGATVVPIGDGLDYEVRERADDIITLVEKAQGIVSAPAPITPSVPAVVEKAKPAKEAEKSADGEVKKDEAPKFEDPNAGAPQVSEAEAANAVAVVTAIKKGTLRRAPAKKTTRKTAKSAEKAEDAKTKTEEPPAEAPKPAAEAEKPAAEPAPAPAPEDAALDVFAASGVRRTVDKTPLDLSTEQVDRLRAMAPKSVKKLLNSINAQFPVADPNSTIQALKDNGIIAVDDKGHVKWEALTIEDVLA